METMAHGKREMNKGQYTRLAVMMLLSFASMYALMYAMVNRWENVYGSFNQFYMAGLMTAPMIVLELLLMGVMYPNKILNRVLLAFGVGAGVLFWILIRQQSAITDRQFLRSMIPHHAGAILMCEELRPMDPKVKRLCGEIVLAQRQEIALMKEMLGETKAVDGDGQSAR